MFPILIWYQMGAIPIYDYISRLTESKTEVPRRFLLTETKIIHELFGS